MADSRKITSQLTQLKNLKGGRVVIVGIGNDLKGDDGAGPFVCRLLTGKTCVDVVDTGSAPENYIQYIIRKKPTCIVIVDAVDFGEEAGRIKIFKTGELNSAAVSTHSPSPGLFIDMICAQTKADVDFVGIQPSQLHLGEGLSAEVDSACRLLAETLIGLLPAAGVKN